MRIETLAVHAGASIDEGTRAVIPAIHLSTTFERHEDGTYPQGFNYTRSGNPTRHALETALAAAGRRRGRGGVRLGVRRHGGGVPDARTRRARHRAR